MTSPKNAEPRSWLRRASAWATAITCVVLLTGCATPDLKPFAEASRALSGAVTAGGTLAIEPIARMPHVTDGASIPPDDARHPAKALRDSWALRRKTMDAILVYSASLAAISEAAQNRRENAAGVVKAVSDLAAAVPGVGVISQGTGALLSFGLGAVVEVKAFHDMREAVASANPAVRLVAAALRSDFGDLAGLYESSQNTLLLQTGRDVRPLEQVHEALRKQRAAERAKVASNAADKTAGAELARLDALMAGIEPELTRVRSARAAAQEAKDGGRNFFKSAQSAVDAWAAAHGDLVNAFDENRMPNLVLLGARIDELKVILDDLRK